jgi:hypothetical protein
MNDKKKGKLEKPNTVLPPTNRSGLDDIALLGFDAVYTRR